jgi:hypothetical protein
VEVEVEEDLQEAGLCCVGKRYGQLVASVGDAFSKAYRNLRALTADVGEYDPETGARTGTQLGMFQKPEVEVDTSQIDTTTSYQSEADEQEQEYVPGMPPVWGQQKR